MRIILCILSTIFIIGCKTDEPDIPARIHPKKLQGNLTEEIKTIRTETENISNAATNSKLSANEIYSNSATSTDSKKLASDIIENLDKILKSSLELNNTTRGLSEVDIELGNLAAYLKEINKNNEDLHQSNDDLAKIIATRDEEIKKYRDGVEAQNNKIWMGIVGLCALFAAAGVAIAIWVNPRVGIGITAASLLLSSIAYFMAKYALIVAYIGGALFVSCIIWAIYYFIIHKKALIESAITVEALKVSPWDVAKTQISNVQSNSTKDLIKSIKHQNQIG